jgi:hypothetical protein
MARVRFSTPALAAQYADLLRSPTVPIADEIVTIAPPPRARKPGSTARQEW